MSATDEASTRVVPIIARCYGLMVLDLGNRRVGRLDLDLKAPDMDSPTCRLVGEPEYVAELDFDPSELEIHQCSSSWCSNYGPREVPDSALDFFQQLRLIPPPSPLVGTEGYYCMGCCLPPR